MVKKLNEAKSEIQEENLLKENPENEFVDINKKVVISKDIPTMVKGTFINLVDPGCAMSFVYKSATHPMKTYTLYHGYEHELPEEVVDHLEGNNQYDPWSCHTRKYKYEEKPDGVKEPVPSEYVPRYQFKKSRRAA